MLALGASGIIPAAKQGSQVDGKSSLGDETGSQIQRKSSLGEFEASMLKTETLLHFLYEFIVLLLGGLLIALAISGRVGLPGRPLALALLGGVLIYWGVRASLRPEPEAHRHLARVRAGSLVLVGILVIGIPYLPVRYAEVLLELAGGVLVLRGIIGGALLLRRA